METPKSQNSESEPTSPIASVVDSNSIETPSESSLPLEHENDSDTDFHFQDHELQRLLFACAQSVAREDYERAWRYLNPINILVSRLATDTTQRVAFYFAQGLAAKLAAAFSINPPVNSIPMPLFHEHPSNPSQILEAYKIFYQACPDIQFGHHTSNEAILKAFENEDCVHVIDLDIGYGYQWPGFMLALASRSGRQPFLRITGVGYPPESIMETGKNLRKLAVDMGLEFKFHPVTVPLQDLKPHMFQRQVGEALAVNCVNSLHRLSSTGLGNLLLMIRNQAPNIVTLVEHEASLNDPCFGNRFNRAWWHYCSIFSSLNKAFPEENSIIIRFRKAKVEQHVLAPQIMNIVACDGPERVERYEILAKWRTIMTQKGFHGVPMCPNSVAKAKTVLELFDVGHDFREDNGCLVMNWKSEGRISVSAWR